MTPDRAAKTTGFVVNAHEFYTRTAFPETAARMVRIRDTIEPTTGSAGRFDEPYLRLVGELTDRGWLEAAVAEHARWRTRT